MKPITVTQYQTSDEKVFFDRIEAVRHQAALDAAEEIAAYVTAQAGEPRNQTRLTNMLTAFVQWKAERAVAAA